jgi:DNA polymerase theta
LNGEPDNIGKPLYKTKLQSGSSNKEVLLKLAKFHKLPQVVLEWRKINAAVTKVVFPMTRAAEDHPGLNMSRIYSVCQTFTATGRVSLHEPNIQNVPKDFDVIATPQLIGKALGNEKG